MYIKIYFKNKMKITWILHEYTIVEFVQISKIILEKTKNAKCILSKCAIICTNQKDLNRIYNILLKWYKKYHINDPNIKIYWDFSNFTIQ